MIALARPVGVPEELLPAGERGPEERRARSWGLYMLRPQCQGSLKEQDQTLSLSGHGRGERALQTAVFITAPGTYGCFASWVSLFSIS